MQKRTFIAGLMASTMLTGAAIAADGWDGPTSGPTAAADKSIVVLAGDRKNGGILGVTSGIEEAAETIGWEVRVLDGAGSVQGRTGAIGQAFAHWLLLRFQTGQLVIDRGFDLLVLCPVFRPTARHYCNTSGCCSQSRKAAVAAAGCSSVGR